jgi:[acyl-carrier-protein] S-malonyltransferase
VRKDLAFLFPGQGSQRIGMLADAASEFPEVRDTLTEASEALGYDLAALLFAGEAETLNLTEFTQPALLATSVALWRVWRTKGGVTPAAMAGHSLGEFSALCCAGVLELSDAVRLVRERGRFMQTAVPVGEGAMAAVLGLDDDQVLQTCESISRASALVQAVNFNAPGQVVIAGHTAAVAAAIEALKAAGAKRAMALPVSAPFHTSLMTPAGEKLQAVLDTIPLSSPQIPVVHNVHAQTESEPQRIRELLVRQISAPVRWTACIATLQSMGLTQFAECGAGKVLGGLLRRIDKSMLCSYLEQPDDLRAALHGLACQTTNG